MGIPELKEVDILTGKINVAQKKLDSIEKQIAAGAKKLGGKDDQKIRAQLDKLTDQARAQAAEVQKLTQDRWKAMQKAGKKS